MASAPSKRRSSGDVEKENAAPNKAKKMKKSTTTATATSSSSSTSSAAAAASKPASAHVDPTRTLHQLKVLLAYSDPAIWRRIVVPSSMTLRELSAVLTLLFEWNGSHTHYFTYGALSETTRLATSWEGTLDPEDDLGDGNEEDLAIEQVAPSKGDQMMWQSVSAASHTRDSSSSSSTLASSSRALTPTAPLLPRFLRCCAAALHCTGRYDTGDSWDHGILVEKVGPARDFAGDGVTTVPVCLAGARCGPPEDCGGIDCHNEIVRAHKVGEQTELYNAEWRSWAKDALGFKFDPERFSVEAINHKLAVGII